MRCSRETVTPEIGDRIYIRNGTTIFCFKAINTGDAVSAVWEPAGDKLFSFTLDTDEHAEMFMEDLFYGEYNGG